MERYSCKCEENQGATPVLKTPVTQLSSLSAGLPPTTLSQRLDLGENQILSSLGVLLAGLSSAIHTGGGVEEIGVL